MPRMGDDMTAAWEPLTHGQRVKMLVALGQAARAGDLAAAQSIRALRNHDSAYERLLALSTIHGTRDGEHVLLALSDPSRTVRRTAARMVPRFCSDGQANEALRSIVERRVLMRTVAALARKSRFDPIERFLSEERPGLSAGRRADLLAFCSPAFVFQAMPDIERSAGPSGIRRLAWYHPERVLEWLTRQAKTAGTVDQRTRYLLFPSLVMVAKRAPDATLSALRELWSLGMEPGEFSAAVRVLVRRRPAETFDLLEERWKGGRPARPPGVFGLARFHKVAHRLGEDRLDFLVRHAWHALPDGKLGPRWFLRLQPTDQKAVLRAFVTAGRGGWGAFLFRYLRQSDTGAQRREQAFERWVLEAKDLHGVIAPTTLDDLPRDLREREANRHLFDCPPIASKPAERIVYASLLSFSAARTALASFLGHPEGELRAAAQTQIIATVRHDRTAIGEALKSIASRQFEQDPVRLAMMQALARLPIARFGCDQLEAVGQVVQHALDAADLSHATAGAVQNLVARLFRVDGGWGARWMAKLLEVRGSVSMWGLGENLTKAEATTLAPHVAELADRWASRERAGSLISLAHALGIRLKVVTPLLAALERLSIELPFVHVAGASLSLLYKHDRPRFARLVPALLDQDRSFVLLPVVAKFVSLCRQDLLSSLLTNEPMKGRFATGRSHWVIDFQSGHGRWTRTQQCRYAEGLNELLADSARDVPTLRFAIATLARLAFAKPDALIGYAADPRPPVREIAIRALPWLDARQGLPTLVDCLGDARARWAIYALRKVFSEMRPAEVLAALRAVPTSKVTVAKEVVRLLGELEDDDAYRSLLAMFGPDTHRDVRIAILRALWDHLEKDETWAVFEQAVNDPDWVVASKLADTPLHRLSNESETRIVRLLAHVLGRSEPEARLDLLARAAWLPLRDHERALFRRLVEHMHTDSTDEAEKALQAALNRMNPSEVDAVVSCIAQLAGRRKRWVAFVHAVAGRLGPYAAEHHLAVARGVASRLKDDVHATPLYLQLAGKLHGYDELAEAFAGLSNRQLLYYDAMVAAIKAVDDCVHPALLEPKLRSNRDPAVRRLGLEALKHAAAPKNGWTKERRDLLARYRNDESPAVAGPAEFVFLPS